MHVIRVRNVAEALPAGIRLLEQLGVREESRAGPVLVYPEPVATVYSNPRERVLYTRGNPFFHLMEAMWMLAGRRDATFLDRYVSDFSQRYAEPGGLQHGAYGRRWRHHFEWDQLHQLVDLLRRDPGTRQAVLAMWDPDVDLNQSGLRDIPCNTHVYFRTRTQQGEPEPGGGEPSVLDMTVCCRSNDIVWGAYGANAVHFSFLQEYMAARIGATVGTYTQVSNNYHIYVDVLEKLPERARVVYDHRMEPDPLVDDPGWFDREVHEVLGLIEHQDDGAGWEPRNRFLSQTVHLAAMAHSEFKRGRISEARTLARDIGSPDWRAACVEWLRARK